jgi:hypothetical protein
LTFDPQDTQYPHLVCVPQHVCEDGLLLSGNAAGTQLLTQVWLVACELAHVLRQLVVAQPLVRGLASSVREPEGGAAVNGGKNG